MGILDRFFGPKFVDKGERIIVVDDGAYWLEIGPIRKEITITTDFLLSREMNFEQAIRHHGLRADYTPGGWDASVPPKRIMVDQPFRYTDYKDKSSFVWKFYKRVNGRLEHIADLGPSRDDAIIAAKQFIKKDT